MLKPVTKRKKKAAHEKDDPKKIHEKLPAVLVPILNSPGKYVFFCPACQENHLIDTTETGFSNGHQLKGSLARPTISPSILSYGDKKTGKPRCHSFITKGKIKFMLDCTHSLAGKTIALKPFE
jgi:hypothetical protein